jgi:hypothetical protein
VIIGILRFGKAKKRNTVLSDVKTPGEVTFLGRNNNIKDTTFSFIYLFIDLFYSKSSKNFFSSSSYPLGFLELLTHTERDTKSFAAIWFYEVKRKGDEWVGFLLETKIEMFLQKMTTLCCKFFKREFFK